MKSLKLDHSTAAKVLVGSIHSTLRINDDKDLAVDDEVELIDKVIADNSKTWEAIGIATIDAIVQKRLSEIDDKDLSHYTEYDTKEAMFEALHNYYGQDINPNITVKIVFFHFVSYKNPKLLYVYDSFIVESIKIFTDGGSRGNPGPSASGYVILDMEDTILIEKGVYLGITTNNQAEYLALKFALEDAHKIGAREIYVYMDSLLVINQMNGIFKVKNRDLWPIYESIKELSEQFKKIKFTHVPRELNKLADAQVNITLDAVSLHKSV